MNVNFINFREKFETYSMLMYQGLGHVILASVALYRARSVDLKSKASIMSFYLFIWKVIINVFWHLRSSISNLLFKRNCQRVTFPWFKETIVVRFLMNFKFKLNNKIRGYISYRDFLFSVSMVYENIGVVCTKIHCLLI